MSFLDAVGHQLGTAVGQQVAIRGAALLPAAAPAPAWADGWAPDALEARRAEVERAETAVVLVDRLHTPVRLAALVVGVVVGWKLLGG